MSPGCTRIAVAEETWLAQSVTTKRMDPAWKTVERESVYVAPSNVQETWTTTVWVPDPGTEVEKAPCAVCPIQVRTVLPSTEIASV